MKTWSLLQYGAFNYKEIENKEFFLLLFIIFGIVVYILARPRLCLLYFYLRFFQNVSTQLIFNT